MTRALVGCSLVLWVGATLLLADTRWARRMSLAQRLSSHDADRWSSPPTLRSVVTIAGPLGDRVARGLGVRDQLASRLDRVHSPLDVAAVRLRQVGWSVAGLAIGLLLAAAGGATTGVAVLLTLTPAALGFLLVEHRVTLASDAWKRRVSSELPIITEQLAMLLDAGYALGPALGRIADRGNGTCAEDLRRVLVRVSQGLAIPDALDEWAETVDVPAVQRLVAVLTLDRDGTDLGRLVSDEAAAMRREAHRDLITLVERRNQQVWIPVTVAALLPGAILLAIPFLAAMQLFAQS